MKYRDKLIRVTSYVEDNFVDVEDVVQWLGISIEDVIKAFPDHLVRKYSEASESGSYTEEDEPPDIGLGEAWEEFEEGNY